MWKRTSGFVWISVIAAVTCSTIWGQAPVPPPQPTLWNFLGIPQALNKIHANTFNRRGNHPGLEKKPPLLKIADPANLKSEVPAIKAAAEIKQAEDLAPQKIKAIKYLASIGCGCYDKDEKVTKALLAAMEDCTEAVRVEAVRAISMAASGERCSQCKQKSCCNEKIAEQLYKLAYELDDLGCFLEPSERVREAAIEALGICCPGRVPITTAPVEAPVEGVEQPRPVEGIQPESAPPPPPMAGTHRPGALVDPNNFLHQPFVPDTLSSTHPSVQPQRPASEVTTTEAPSPVSPNVNTSVRRVPGTQDTAAPVSDAQFWQALEAAIADVQKLGSQGVDSRPVAPRQADSPPVESQHVESKPVISPTIAPQRVESQRVESPRVASQPMDSPRVATKRMETERVESKSAETPRVASQAPVAPRPPSLVPETPRPPSLVPETPRPPSKVPESPRVEKSARRQARVPESPRQESPVLESQVLESPVFESQQVEIPVTSTSNLPSSRRSARLKAASHTSQPAATTSPPAEATGAIAMIDPRRNLAHVHFGTDSQPVPVGSRMRVYDSTVTGQHAVGEVEILESFAGSATVRGLGNLNLARLGRGATVVGQR